MTSESTISQRPEYSDITPIPQDDGPNPPAPIAYTQEYKEIMDYLRAFLQADELSQRALDLTTEAIDLNPANYTVWHFRRRILRALGSDLQAELKFMDQVIEENEKNYQVWFHRQCVVDMLRDPSQEMKFTAEILSNDAKNYHTWAHRQWVAEEFNMWDEELSYTETLLDHDFRNNSAWNHRFFVLRKTTDMDTDTRVKEVEKAFSYLRRAPNNESAWNYARGMCSFGSNGSDDVWASLLSHTEDILARQPAAVHAHAAIVFWGEHAGTKESLTRASEECSKLVEIDGIRNKYWSFRKNKIKNKLETLS
eukprot:gb/GECH01014778.1/.p1 GENE.gb/GECH01014778.1/~~gb/GECH01014778.1/.p1  ORF type:complete len:309 (+),score=54.56 gb/GECH01014778.1/:1-927(+)